MERNIIDLQSQAEQIIEKAKAKGIQQDYFFTTTFNRYRVQMKILEDLEKAIEEYGATVTKEYVKGRQNLVANPAITEYNRTSTAANGTVVTLINILKSIPDEAEKKDALAEFLSENG